MHTAKSIEVEASYKNCHSDIYFKAKTVVDMQRNAELSAVFLQALN